MPRATVNRFCNTLLAGLAAVVEPLGRRRGVRVSEGENEETGADELCKQRAHLFNPDRLLGYGQPPTEGWAAQRQYRWADKRRKVR